MTFLDDTGLGSCLRCEGTDKEDDLHPEKLCPYDEDIYSKENMCTCCPDHRGQCGDDI